MPVILPPELRAAQDRRLLATQLRGRRASQLVVPSPHPAMAYGGTPSSTWFIPVTHGSFNLAQAGQPWVCVLDRLCRRGVAIDIPWVTDAATPGELRLRLDIIIDVDIISNVASLAAASSGTVKFRWLHDREPWIDEEIWLYIEARRVSGAGNVNIGYPAGGARQLDPGQDLIVGGI